VYERRKMGSNDNNAIHKETVKFSILYLLFQFVFPFFLAGILLIVFIPLNDNVINSYYSWIKVEEEFAFLIVTYFFEIIIFTIMSFVFGYKIKCILKNVNEKRIIFISVILSSLVILCNYYSKELLLFIWKLLLFDNIILISSFIIFQLIIFIAGILMWKKNIKIKKSYIGMLVGVMVIFFIILSFFIREHNIETINSTKKGLLHAYDNKKTLNEFCGNNKYKLLLVTRREILHIKLTKDKKENVWRGTYRLEFYGSGTDKKDETANIIYKNGIFYDEKTKKEIEKLKGFKLYFQVAELNNKSFKVNNVNGTYSSVVTGEDGQSEKSSGYINKYLPDHMGENANEGFRVETDGIELEYSEKEPYLTSIRIVDSVKYTISEICTSSDEYWDYDDYSVK
jgi:membrane protein